MEKTPNSEGEMLPAEPKTSTRPIAGGVQPEANPVSPDVPQNVPPEAAHHEEKDTLTMPVVDDAEAGNAAPKDGMITALDLQLCPVCGNRFRPGELACSQCGYMLANAGRTHKFDETRELGERKSWPTGEVLAGEQKPITFEIGGKSLTVLVAEVTVLGRNSGIPGDAQPDIDLTSFDAESLGVSRRHLRIRRKGILIYVADLNSMNGTLLNGRKLIPEGERLIRSGDELRLGHLKMRVRF